MKTSHRLLVVKTLVLFTELIMIDDGYYGWKFRNTIEDVSL
jgi:hypothetical protein